MEWLITEQCAWFIFGGIIGYTFMFVVALLAIKRLKKNHEHEKYELRSLLNEERCHNKLLQSELMLANSKAKLEAEKAKCWLKAIDSLEKGYGKEINQIIADEIESNEEKE